MNTAIAIKDTKKIIKRKINLAAIMAIVSLFVFTLVIPSTSARNNEWIEKLGEKPHSLYDAEGNLIGKTLEEGVTAVQKAGFPFTWVVEILEGASVVAVETVRGPDTTNSNNQKSPYAGFHEFFVAITRSDQFGIKDGGGATVGYKYTNISADKKNWTAPQRIEQVMEIGTGALQALGIAMLLAYAIAHMLESIEQGKDTLEAATKFFLELCFGAVVILNVNVLLDLLANIGTLIANVFSGILFSGTDSLVNRSTVLDVLRSVTGKDHGGFWEWQLGCAIELIIPYALNFITKVAASFAILSILIELAIRKIFAPLAVVNIYNEGLRSPGIRYFKKYFATALKLALCVAISLLTTILILLCIDAKGNLLLIVIIAIQFSGVGLMFKGGDITNDVIGV